LLKAMTLSSIDGMNSRFTHWMTRAGDSIATATGGYPDTDDAADKNCRRTLKITR
jgi:hypothetical protein